MEKVMMSRQAAKERFQHGQEEFERGRREGLEEAARLCEENDCSRMAKKVRAIAHQSDVGQETGLDKP